jgi:hypothetical protein
MLAIAVAVFPAATGVPTGALTRTDVTIGRVHQVSAAALFLLLAAFCIFLFPRGGSTVPATPRTRVRNGIYYTCGFVIIGAVALAVASNALPDSTRDTLKPLFWCEAVAVLAFGAAWLVKAEAMFRDSQGADDPPGSGVQDPTEGSTSPTGATAGS